MRDRYFQAVRPLSEYCGWQENGAITGLMRQPPAGAHISILVKTVQV
jgi:hypothetical protein